jgi:hypothetical protein
MSMSNPQTINLSVTINNLETAMESIAKALSDKLYIIAGKKLPDGVYRIDGTDMIYMLTEKVAHYEAKGVVAKLELVPGHTLWDLAEPREAVLLVDYSKYKPAVDTAKHPGINSELCWLKDTNASSPAVLAWVLDFDAGGIYRVFRYHQSRALAVCRPLPASQQ